MTHKEQHNFILMKNENFKEQQTNSVFPEHVGQDVIEGCCRNSGQESLANFSPDSRYLDFIGEIQNGVEGSGESLVNENVNEVYTDMHEMTGSDYEAEEEEMAIVNS